MGDSLRIRESDFGAMIRLAGEAGELPTNSDARRRHMLDGLCRMLGGAGGLMFTLGQDPRRRLLDQGSRLLTVGLEPAHGAAFNQYLRTSGADHSDPHNPIVPLVLRRMDPLLTQHRHQVSDDERAWYHSPYFQEFQRPLGLDHTLYPRCVVPGHQPLALAVFRPLNDRPFTDRDCQLVDLFHQYAGQLYGRMDEPVATPANGAPVLTELESLPPRLKPVLNHLLQGDAEKQVAVKLGLSRHTVHEYVKMLYRKLGVSSRGELLARFVTPMPPSAMAG